MKFGKDELKKLIKEIIAEHAISETEIVNEVYPEPEPEMAMVEEQYTKFELESLHSLRSTNKLLSELLTQMKTVTYFTTPGRSPVESGLEKAVATGIQEEKK